MTCEKESGMGDLPWLKWFPRDWLGDPLVSALSPSARGIWKDAIDAMHELDAYRLVGSVETLARTCRCTPSEMQSAIAEFRNTGAVTVHENDAVVTLVSRRRRKEAKARESAAERQRRHRGGNGHATVTPPSQDCHGVEVRGQRSEKEPPSPPDGGPVFPAGLDTPEFRAAWGQYVAYRRENGWKPLQPRSVAAKFAELARIGSSVAVAAIQRSIANGWHGVFPPGSGTPQAKPTARVAKGAH